MRKKAEDIRLSDSIPAGDGLLQLLNAYKLEGKYLQTLITSKWDKLMGGTVASRTEKIYFKEQTMYVVMKSASLKHQLTLSKSKIVILINDEIGKKVIDDVIFI